MRTNTKVALLLCVAVVAGSTGLALAQMDGPMPPDGPMQGLLHRARMADRLLSEFDVNHDGRITHAEFNNVLGSRFAAATHGAKLMPAAQFLALHQADFQKHAAEMFHRVDWNGDGRLSLEEFAAPQRAHFEMMDRDGSGSVSCSPSGPAASRPGGAPNGRGPRNAGSFGRARFCNDADLSRDGRVTRGEFDTMTARDFSAAAGGAAFLSWTQFVAYQGARYRDINAKMFARADRDGDGQLTLAEFAASSERLFDRLDRNHDGAVTADEMKPRTRGRFARGGRDNASPDARGD